MKIIITKDYKEMSAKVFEIMKMVVKNNPYAVLGLATGTTPLGLYRYMIEDHKLYGTSYVHIRTVNLDEYKGLSKDHPQSYAYFMRENLFRHLDIEASNTYIENGTAHAHLFVIFGYYDFHMLSSVFLTLTVLPLQ